ncbi:Ig-like domain-containing protein, partial [Shewanella sp. 1CM18E]|uniref:Ig-like domain-containing protein n=1 Tax=Shewanella sp. 1CM18E TaxID=2929169 RepID=UPI0020BFAF15
MKSIFTTQVGYILNLNGTVTANIDGNTRELTQGDLVPAETNLLLAENSSLEIQYDDGSILNSEPFNSEDESLSEIAEIQALIAAGEDPTEGPDTAAGGQSGNEGGSSLVSIARGGAETIAASGFDTDIQANTQTIDTNDSLNPNNNDLLDSPTIVANDNQTIAEDGIATGNVLDNDSDVDSDLSVTSFEINGEIYTAGTTIVLDGGSLVINEDGSYTFTPNADWNGSVPVITYTTNTGETATLTLEVTAVDDPSIVANDSNTIAEDGIATGNVLDNDSDVDSDLSVTSFEINGETYAAGTTVVLDGGSLVINEDGSYTFTPNADWNGSVPVITYITNTGETATLTLEVTVVDDPSIVANDSQTIAEDGIATGNVLANDSDVDSDLTVTSFEVNGETYTAGTTVVLDGGSLVINEDGSYTFTPNADWNGSVPVITYTTNTGETATLTLEVTAVDDPSIVANDNQTIAEDGIATGNVLDNDSDVDSDLSVTSFEINGETYAAGTTVVLDGGSLVINEDGSYTFTPNADWNGSVPVITYTTNTGETATLTLEVTAVDDPSIVANDSQTIAEDDVATGNVLDNDSDVDNDLTVTSFEVNGETYAAGTTVVLDGGSLVINEDGSYTFTPNADWNSSVPVITYTTNTGETATLTLEVTAVDDPSIVANDSQTIAEDGVATGNVLANDSDVDSDLSVTSFEINGETYAAGTTVVLDGGSLVINEDGSYTFTPNADWNGSVPVITYTTNTGETATLTLEVTAVDDPSIVANDSNTIAEDGIATGNVLDNDSDVDSDLSVTSFEINGETYAAGTTVVLDGGSLVINEDGSYTFTPNADWNGSVPVITYTTNTGETATLTLEVTAVDDPSIVANDSQTIAEDDVATGNVLDNDSDVDNDLTVTSFEVNGETYAAGTTVVLDGGSLVINEDGSYTFTPNADWNGSVPVITYTTNTGETATLTLEVTPTIDGAPQVTITTDIDNDGIINSTELNGGTNVNATIDLTGTGAQVGDTLTVNGTEIVLTQEDINNGSVDVTLPSPGEGNEIVVVATITDQAGNTSAPGSDSAVLDAIDGNITINLTVNDNAETANISGSTTDVAPGTTVTLTLTDSAGNTQDITGVTVNDDGTYSIGGIDISGLVDGDITVNASAEDRNGNTVNDEATDNMDATDGDLTVALTVNDNAETANISGTTTDVAPGSTVTLTLTDSAGNTQDITGVTVNDDGTYSIDGVDISGLVDGDITVNASAEDRNGNTVNGSDTDNMDATDGDLTVALTVNDNAETANISGTTTDVAPGTTVTLTLTDSAGNTQDITGVTVNADGTYSIDGVDISGLVDGDITVNASAEDRNGNAVNGSDTDNMDATDGALTVALTVDDNAETANISGTTTDVAPGSTVTLTLTDSAGNVQQVTGVTVNDDGTYSIDDVDISGLVDGDIKVEASAEDRNGNTVNHEATDNMDATDGALTVALTVNDNAETANISGTTTDVAPGSTVTLTLTDSAGKVQIVTGVTVNDDGTYSIDDVDISGLVDGDIKVEASADDRNGNTVNDEATDNMDATDGALTVALTVDDNAETANISGTTTDVAPDSTVTLTLTDSAGNVQQVTGVTVNDDGTYSIDGVDISGLVDGGIKVEASAEDRNGNTVNDEATDNMDATDGALTVALTVDDNAETANISGTTTDVAPDSTVTLTLTDSAGNVQQVTGVTVNDDGTYSIDGVDISGLVDGDIKVEASAEDRNGNTVNDEATDNMDATDGALTVALTVDDNAETANISGTTTDVAPGTTVTLTLTDSAGNVQQVTGVTVNADGTYSIDGVDISGLVDGDITVNASAEDRNGNTVNGSDTDNMDATDGALTVALTVDDNAETANISGTTTDVAPGSTVTLTLTDSAGNVQQVTGVTVNDDGTYSIDGVDISGLVDGDITVNASAEDRNGNTVNDEATDNMDATDGALTVALTVNDNAETANISGTTTDVAPGTTVTLTLTDSAGKVQIVTGVTVNDDGTYS